MIIGTAIILIVKVLLLIPEPVSPHGEEANVNKCIEGGMPMSMKQKVLKAIKRVKVSITLKLPLVNVTFAPAILLQLVH